MSYQALYRVWRPQTFDELVGQSVITDTLKNAIKHDQTSHAYLFTGPRGTGKTSAAKIFAKAINCPNQEDGNPCNQCDLCQAITQGQLSDVVEIDAASNNGVEEIRNLRDNVRYAASTAPYKVYIIDEVHMLTTGAFNALLKTLEEPPAQVVFILATTEPHKIPATIISRTQRFDFQRITQQHLVDRMKTILDYDQLAYQDEALEIIARASNGGMRDSLSLLDQAISYKNNQIDLQAALEITGSLSQIALIDYLLAIHKQQSEDALEILNQQLAKGKQAGRFVEELILLCRDLLLTMHSSSNHTLLSQEEIQPILDQIPSDFLYQCVDALNKVQDKMRFAIQEDLYVEVMTIQLAEGMGQRVLGQAGQDVARASVDHQEDIGKLKAQIQHLQEEIHRLKNSSGHVVTAQGPSKTLSEDQSTPADRIPRQKPRHLDNQYKLELQEVYSVLNQATRRDKQEMSQAWQDILGHITPQTRVKLRSSKVLAVGPELALVSIQEMNFVGAVQHDQTLNQELFKIMTEQLQKPKQIIWILDSEWSNVRKQYTLQRQNHVNQEVPIDAKVQQALATVRQSYLASISSNQKEEDSLENVSTTDMPHGYNQVTTPSNTEESRATSQASPSEDVEMSRPENDESQLDEIDDEDNGKDNLPEHVSKAIELFGEENIHIHYDS